MKLILNAFGYHWNDETKVIEVEIPDDQADRLREQLGLASILEDETFRRRAEVAERALEAYRQAETREIPTQWRRNAHAAAESGPGLSAKAPGAAPDYRWVDPLNLLADDA